MQRPTILLALLLAALTGPLAAPAGAQLCAPSADPCIVSSSITVPSGSIFDLGTRDLIIAANQTLTVQGAGLLTIVAGDITLDDGARIVANGNTGVGGDVLVAASGVLRLDPSSRIDVSGGAGGSLLLEAAAVQIDGQLRANATLRDSEGGLVSILSSGNVLVAGTGILGSSGNRFGCGGLMEIIADGSVTVSAPIEFKGGDCDGGDIDIDALGSVTIASTGVLNTLATYEFGSGGSVALTAGGDVVVNGTVLENGEGSFLEGGGDGGDFDIIGANVTIAGLVSLNAGAPDGGGGFLDITADGFIRLNQAISLVGAAQGIGGDVLLGANGNVELNHTINAAAGFVGGSVDAVALGDVVVNAAATIDASGTGSAFGQFGGTIDLTGCNVTVPLGADLLATGPGAVPRASIHVAASNLMTIGGTLNAGALVELRYRLVPPAFTPGFVISPAPVIVADPALPCCVGCGVTTTLVTTSTSTSSSSTSSTIGGSTSTIITSTTSTSTSSTTIPVPCGAPLAGCRTSVQPFKAKLIVKDKTSGSDKLVWKWIRGQATSAADFGDPVASDDYVLCVWSVAGSPTLLARVDAPAGGTCDGNPCWRATGRSAPKGFKYVDPDLTPNGGHKVVLAAGTAGKAKAVVKAKGGPLAIPTLPVTLPLLVQLQGAGRCFETYFTAAGAVRNDADAFEARASFPSTTTTTSTSSTSTTSPIPICGNGAVEFPEQCDDGNVAGGDCCSAVCMAEPLAQPCAEDGNVCTLDVCSGLGLCVHPPGNPGVVCRPAADVCDAAEQCTGVTTTCPADAPVPDGTSCESDVCVLGETCQDGTCGGGTPLTCGACEACDATAGCVATPAQVCRHTVYPEKSTLLVKDRTPDESDKLIWKWARGEETSTAEFGTPPLDDDYTLCVYDESTFTPALVTELAAPAGGVCGSNACWRTTSKGFKYVDPLLTPSGTQRVLLKAGAHGAAGIVFKAKGVPLPMPDLPLGALLRVQLRGNDDCWEATFSPGGITQNDETGLKARSD